MWISRQVREDMAEPPWANATMINRLGRAYAEVSRRLGRCIYSFYLIRSTAAEIFGFRGIPHTRIVALNKWELTPFRAKSGDGPSCGRRSDPDTVLGTYWEMVARNSDRAPSRFARSEWFRNYPRDEPRAFECDVPSDEPSSDEDPPPLPWDKCPTHTLLGDFASSSDPDDAKSPFPSAGGRLRTNRAASASLPFVRPGPVNPEDSSSSKISPTKQPGDQPASDAPPAERPLTDPQKNRDMSDADKEFRGCLHVLLRGHQKSAQLTTVLDIEHAFRNSLEWPLYEVTSPIKVIHQRIPRTSYVVSLLIILPLPIPVAMDTCGATQVHTHDPP